MIFIFLKQYYFNLKMLIDGRKVIDLITKYNITIRGVLHIGGS